MLSNPPFGVEWKKIQKEITKEATEQGYNGRFGPGPRVGDGSLLFLLHLIYVFKPPRPLAEIDADLKGCTDRILTMIEGLSAS